MSKQPIFSNDIVCPTPADFDALLRILGSIKNLWTAQSALQAAGFVCRSGAWEQAPIDTLERAWEQYIEGQQQ